MSAALNTTSYIILGLLNHGPMSGYDVKAMCDQSTRFFWQISYGQIYPELRKLVELELAEREPEPVGGRARNVHRITKAGEEVLKKWASDPGEGSFEMRDELLLKLFFADAGGPQMPLAILQRIRARHEGVVAELRAVQRHIDQLANPGETPSPLTVLQAGLHLHQAYIDFCRSAEEELTRPS